MFDSDEKVDISFLLDDLNDLVQMHYDLLSSYHSVLAKARSYSMKAVVEKFINQHGVQIATLSQFIQRYGGEARKQGDLGKVGAKMRIAVGHIFHDAGIYTAMRTNEQKLLLEYERDIRSLSVVPGLESVLLDNYHWAKERITTIDEALEEMRRPPKEAGGE